METSMRTTLLCVLLLGGTLLAQTGCDDVLEDLEDIDIDLGLYDWPHYHHHACCDEVYVEEYWYEETWYGDSWFFWPW